MSRSPEYQQFLDVHNLGKSDGLPDDEEIEATDKDIGWREQQQVARAIHRVRYKVPTPDDIDYLGRRSRIIPISSQTRMRTKRIVQDRGY